MCSRKLIKFILLTHLFFSPITFSQDISTITCRTHEMIMENQILPFRKQGVYTLSEAQNSFNDESDVRTRVFLKDFVTLVYKQPALAEKYLRGGQFMSVCLKAHRGY